MRYQTYIPRPPLANFVELFWWYESDRVIHTKERVLPTGAVQLIINLHEDVIRTYNPHNPEQFQSFLGCLVAGPYTEFTVIDTASQVSTLGVSFKPGGSFPFLKLPTCELQNMDVSLDTLWAAAASCLREQLLEAATPRARFRLLERALLAQLTESPAPHPAVAFAVRELQKPIIPPISTVTDQIGLSPRCFIQHFRQEVGLTPKLFSRVQRFQRVLLRLQPDQAVDWADVALSCGYFDQAHFIHDFQAFSGLNPTTYLAQRNGHYNHVLLPD
ncbi:MAG: helix-turn-helix domain-containing protein [Anaerolineae bacterium]|nr:helix-turn-helix domain-containing protein [Anaerolineae bacterium]